MAVKKLKDLMAPHSIFEEVFKKELQDCYDEATRFSEGGDDRNAAIELAKATVWRKLLSNASYKYS